MVYNTIVFEGILSIKNKQKKALKYVFAAGFAVSLLIFFVSPTHAQVSACQTSSTNTGEKGPQFVFTIPGSTVETTDAPTQVTPTIQCCCNFNTFPKGEIPNGTALTECPSSCLTLKSSKVSRDQYLPQPTSIDLKPDTSSPFYPLKGISDVISKWYAAMFYLAVVLAIIQIFRGGIEYAIAAGNSSKTEEAKAIIVEAVIGLGVALLAAAILVFLRGPGVFTFNP